MSDEISEGRGATRPTPQIEVGHPLPATATPAATAHAVVAPTSTRRRPRKRAAGTIFRAMANLVFMALVIYLTYFFTMFISNRPTGSPIVSEDDRVAAKKIEELRAEDRKLLTTYGPVNPATKAVRIPIDRAMELLAAESSQPAPAGTGTSAPTPTPGPAPDASKAVAAGSSPKPADAASTTKAGAVALAPNPATPPRPPMAAPTRIGLAPEQMYRAICIACHDVNGRGTIVRKAMPAIPDFTDPKWQASRTDADLQHSIIDGKGQLMLAMKDKLALAHTDVNEMVAYVRSYQPGRSTAAAGSGSANPAPATPPPATALAAGPAATSAPPAPSPATALTTSPPAIASAPSAPAPTNPVASAPVPPASTPLTSMAALPTTSTAPVSTAAASARSAKLRAAAEFYGANCIACHGPDGKGSIIRVAMPVIPDFTSRDWQMTHENPLLAISILEGKNTLMPPWRGRVDPALAQDLVSFVRGFGPADLLAANKPTSELGTRLKTLRRQWLELDQQARTLSAP